MTIDHHRYFNEEFNKKLKDKKFISEFAARFFQINKDWQVSDGIQYSTDIHFTALHLAAQHDLDHLVKLFLKNGADINALAYEEKIDNGDGVWTVVSKTLLGTPLDWAIKNNSEKVMVLLQNK